ncbi:hypothetical protein CBR_g22149 [Chara braunii]|uniref:AGC-kinase C-terminal domain-containing protein n=1 Tax=Chara braunii TaxID=69332 RepID=A0A388L280_CHABU|nr:hypothetical protein CBR_g22149 [Chara braunii]|eukprot:GBG76401.1 hypothetical protein CBR_g22149 [Chara braunii]
MCPLRLPVRLWMSSRTWFHLGVGFLHERSPECRHETSVAVADDVFRNAAAANPAGVQEVRKFGSRGVVLAREKSRVFTQSVNDREDAVVPEVVAGKRTGDVHSNGEVGFPWNRHRAQLAVGIAVAGLASLTNFARVAVPSDIGNEVGPSESLSKSCNSAIYSEMAGESRVVVLAEKVSPKTTVSFGNLKGGAKDIKIHPWFAGVDWEAVESRSLPAPIKPNVTVYHRTSFSISSDILHYADDT